MTRELDERLRDMVVNDVEVQRAHERIVEHPELFTPAADLP
jgi:hypothetical protein